MSTKPLVSIITPCFNGESFLNRYFNSVLNQTYPNIELIFVNDGSTDKTGEIALSYKDKLEKKGYSFIYIYQENAGQAAAINKGLKIFKGEYLTWPDSDDWMTNDCIEKKVDFLEKNRDLGLVTCETAYVNENNLNHIIAKYSFENCQSRLVFEEIYTGKLHCSCGSYLIRTAMFIDANPNRDIFITQIGQNWQMLLPISYKYKCGFLDSILYYIVVRENSHSHSLNSYNKLMQRYDGFEKLLHNLIDSIEMKSIEERQRHHENVFKRYIILKFRLACKYKNIIDIKKFFQQLQQEGLVNKKIKIEYLRARNKLFDVIYRILYFPYKTVRNIIRSIKND